MFKKNYYSMKGDENLNRVLNENQVKEIVQHLLEGKFPKEIAKKYGVNYQTIKSIARKETWTHLTKNVVFEKFIERQKDGVIKLDETKVLKICQSLKQDRSKGNIIQLSKDYGVGSGTINSILKKETWLKVTSNFNFGEGNQIDTDYNTLKSNLETSNFKDKLKENKKAEEKGLTQEEIKAIKEIWNKRYYNTKQIAEAYKVDVSVINNILFKK